MVEKLVHYRPGSWRRGWLEADEDLAPVSFSSEYRSRKKDRRSLRELRPRERRRRRSQDHEAWQAGHQQGAGGAAQERDRSADRVLPAPRPRRRGRPRAGRSRRRSSTAAGATTSRRRSPATIASGSPVASGARSGSRLTLTMLAGSELDDRRACGRRPARLEVVLSDDERLLPLQHAAYSIGASPPASSCSQDCSGEAGCQLAAR